MRSFTKLNLGFSNAENYRRRENKDIFSRYFVRDENLERIIDSNIYFLVGEKGTGKTAYSTYLSNTKYKNKNSFSFDVRQTEYQKFIEIKKSGNLPLSQYSEVWSLIFLILSATSVLSVTSTPAFLQRFTKISHLKKAIDDFYKGAFSPEIVKILSFIQSSENSASLIAKYSNLDASLSSKKRNETRDQNSTFQTNILSIRRSFEDAISSLKLDEDFILFIDGIDVRPANIPYDEYFDCVRGIIEATWSVNNDFFANIKDSRGRIKVVLLVRPDIFFRSGLHNVNTKVRDNSVLLDWKTAYKDHRTSRLFSVADRMLSVQNDEVESDGAAWDFYFPFEAGSTVGSDSGEADSTTTSFISFLRFSYHRPRDINAMMSTLQEILKRRGEVVSVERRDFDDPTFRDALANYLLGELKDQLLFYYSQSDYELFLAFFSYLDGKMRFSYDEYLDSFHAFIDSCSRSSTELPKFFESSDVFLQFLFEQNVICYKEGEGIYDQYSNDDKTFIRWCFRERTSSNLNPKVRTHVNYEIFYGLTKALNIGKRIRVDRNKEKREIGTVIKAKPKSNFGFIRGGTQHLDYYFKFFDLEAGYKPRVGDRVSYTATIENGKTRAKKIRRA
ncbi:P-loop ATPase, Sll1717 family [Martelella limonii]|uniref:P-loop ATPase, Sll1717 family n=1 Tax=Martelella limonii TaxID=1647649 RepID=UPI0015802D34|nr:funZ protein [Martelella limonii]